jgi:hypothetical protein
MWFGGLLLRAYACLNIVDLLSGRTENQKKLAVSGQITKKWNNGSIHSFLLLFTLKMPLVDFFLDAVLFLVSHQRNCGLVVS